jgi:hypothetical protein
MLNAHPNTIRRWSEQGMIKSFRIGSRGDRRFKQSDIDTFIAGVDPVQIRSSVTSGMGNNGVTRGGKRWPGSGLLVSLRLS